MKKIHFQITKGEKYYCASAKEFFIVTQAKTLDGLMKNIIEATELHMEEVGHYSSKKTIKIPSLLLNFEIPSREHAEA